MPGRRAADRPYQRVARNGRTNAPVVGTGCEPDNPRNMIPTATNIALLVNPTIANLAESQARDLRRRRYPFKTRPTLPLILPLHASKSGTAAIASTKDIFRCRARYFVLRRCHRSYRLFE